MFDERAQRDPVTVRMNILALVMQGTMDPESPDLVPLLGRLEAWVTGGAAADPTYTIRTGADGKLVGFGVAEK